VTPDWERAAKAGDAADLAGQIRSGADPDAADRYGQTALMVAATRGHLEAVRVLIRAGADLDRAAKFGLSAMMLAVVNHHQAVAEVLAEAGADLTRRGTGAPGFAGRTASDLARERGFTVLAERLTPPA